MSQNLNAKYILGSFFSWMSRVQMLKFSNEQALSLQQAFAPSAPSLVPPPSMQPSAIIITSALPTLASTPSQEQCYEMSMSSRALLGSYIAVAVAFALCDIASPRSMQVTGAVVGPVLIIALAAHAACSSPLVCCLGLCCAVLYPFPVLVASVLPSWAYCVSLGFFLALSAPRSSIVRLGVWVCMAGLVLTSVLLFVGVHGRSLWGPVFTLLCMQAALTLWIKGPLRLSCGI